MLLILGGVRARDIPAADTAYLHGLPLPHIHAQLFIEMVCQLHITILIIGAVVSLVVAAFAAFDDDEFAGAFVDGVADFRKPF